MQDQRDPSQIYMLVVFETEEKARTRELDPRRRVALAVALGLMADLYEAPPEFVDLVVNRDSTP